jgi:hypothetical protein
LTTVRGFNLAIASSARYRSANSRKTGIFRDRERDAAGSSPSATAASISFAAARAWSGVSVPTQPSTKRRFATLRPPAPGRYSTNQLFVPRFAARTPKPLRSVS